MINFSEQFWICQKKARMFLRRGLNTIKKIVTQLIFWFPIILSILIVLLIITPSLFHRYPIYSYFSTELRLPYTYSLNGNICFHNSAGSAECVLVTISVGGYSQTINSNDSIHLKFLSATSQKIPVVITYNTTNGKKNTQIEYLSFDQNVYSKIIMWSYRYE